MSTEAILSELIDEVSKLVDRVADLECKDMRITKAAIALQARLDHHFGGPVVSHDWKEQAELREALSSAVQGQKDE